jgi:hypothetical protein
MAASTLETLEERERAMAWQMDNSMVIEGVAKNPDHHTNQYYCQVEQMKIMMDHDEYHVYSWSGKQYQNFKVYKTIEVYFVVPSHKIGW